MKQNKKKTSETLRQKLLFYFLGFSAIILGALWLTQTVFFDDLYRTVKTHGIERSAEYICENINDENIVNILDNMYLQNNMHIEVYDTLNYTLDETHGVKVDPLVKCEKKAEQKTKINIVIRVKVLPSGSIKIKSP